MATLKAGISFNGWVTEPGPHGKALKSVGPIEVWFVKDNAGREGVLKLCTAKSGYTKKRFNRELELMSRLRGAVGVLPVLDIDASIEQKWFVTERAVLLAERIAAPSQFWAVVYTLSRLASTLADLNDRLGITHRDLKPDNLFWLHGEPLVGDFGIAHDPSASRLTDAGRKAGPWGYIAPEALNNVDVQDWRPADVYSLVKCLWKFLHNDSYPPQGPLLILQQSNDLFPVGGEAATELSRLLEACSAESPLDRPSMRELYDELTCWLSNHPADSISPGNPWSFWNPGRNMQNASRAGEDAIVEHCVRGVLDPLRNCLNGPTDLDKVSASDLELDEATLSSITGGDSDWTADFHSTLALQWDNYPDVRIVVEGVGTRDDATYLGQWQARDHDNANWQPMTSIHHTSGRMWFPSDFSTRTWLSDRLRADTPAELLKRSDQGYGSYRTTAAGIA